MSELEFIDELPGKRTNLPRPEHPNWEILRNNPGKWTPYWGNLKTGYQIQNVIRMKNQALGRNQYEGATRQGVAYVRAVVREED